MSGEFFSTKKAFVNFLKDNSQKTRKELDLDSTTIGLDDNIVGGIKDEFGREYYSFPDDYTHTTLLNELPSEIQNLKNIRKLILSNNKLTSLPPEIGELTNLEVLDVSGNDLSILPLEICKLENLRELTIDSNLIAQLPSNINLLRNLETISATENKIISLPSNITKLKNLSFLDLRSNPLSIPPEILEKRTEPESIFAVYFSSKRRPLLEAKVLFVGQGSVGKTSLKTRLINNIFDPNENKTSGIAIHSWDVSNPTNKSEKIHLNVWDFGGQEVMHATHQFFLTKRSLYILVLDTRLTQEENRVEYWLKLIQSFGGNSPIIIVGNKTDQHPLDINRRGLLQKYKKDLNIIGILETSAKTGKGIQKLRNIISKEVVNIPHVKDTLPEKWLAVKSELEGLGKIKNFITQEEYLNICSTAEIKDEINQRTLIGFLHDLGVVLHFQDDPRLESLGILNPRWVTNGVYKILNSHDLFQNKGQLTLGMLNSILNSPEYPRDKRLFLIDMMKRFELCYDLKPDRLFFIPDLLPKDEPKRKKTNIKGTPAFQYHYLILPSSVITRFIVRVNQHISDNIVWRTGVVLQFDKIRAVVRSDSEDKKISIYIDGPQHKRRDALAVIRYQLDEIHNSIIGLKPQKRIPIPGALYAEPLEYEYLLLLEQKGVYELQIKNGNQLETVDVRDLLSAIETEISRKEIASKITNIIIRGGVSKSNFIIGDKNILRIENNFFQNAYNLIQKSTYPDKQKAILSGNINKIENELVKGDQADLSYIKRRLQNLKKTTPDIADVALTSLIRSGTTTSTVIKKIAKKIKNDSM